MIDWNDPELNAIRREFVASLAERRLELQTLLRVGDFESLRKTAHKLSGAAVSFGFGELAEVAAMLETSPDVHAPQMVEAAVRAVDQVLAGSN